MSFLPFKDQYVALTDCYLLWYDVIDVKILHVKPFIGRLMSDLHSVNTVFRFPLMNYIRYQIILVLLFDAILRLNIVCKVQILYWKVHDCWVFFEEKLIFRESLNM